MSNDVEVVKAEHRAQRRAEQRHAQVQQPEPITEALAMERCAAHGDDTGRKFRNGVQAELVSLSKNLEALRQNPTMNAAQLLLAAGDMVQTRANKIVEGFSVEREVLAGERNRTHLAIDEALHPPRQGWLERGAEIRSVLRGMSEAQRSAFLKSVEGTRDELLVQYAVAGVPAALSGVSHEAHARAFDALLERRDPALLTKPKDLAERARLLDVCEAGFNRSIAELVDADKVAAVRALSGQSL